MWKASFRWDIYVAGASPFELSRAGEKIILK
jgi:hypothetical protein